MEAWRGESGAHVGFGNGGGGNGAPLPSPPCGREVQPGNWADVGCCCSPTQHRAQADGGGLSGPPSPCWQRTVLTHTAAGCSRHGSSFPAHAGAAFTPHQTHVGLTPLATPHPLGCLRVTAAPRSVQTPPTHPRQRAAGMGRASLDGLPGFITVTLERGTFVPWQRDGFHIRHR